VLLVGQPDSPDRIPPGQSAELQVEVGTAALEGPIAKRFLVITDATEPDLAEVEFLLRADVRAYVEAIPSQLEFGVITGRECGHRNLSIRSCFADLEKRLLSIESDSSFMTASVVDQKPGLMTCDVAVDAQLPPGEYVARLTLRFDIPECPELMVLGRARVVAGDIEVVPTHLDVGAALEKQLLSQKLHMRSRSGKAFRIIEVEAPAGMEVSWAPVKESAIAYVIVVRVTADPPKSGSPKALALKIDNPDEPILRIPVIDRRSETR
jgi:hypothetical protein